MQPLIKRDLANVDFNEVAELYWAGMIVAGGDPHLSNLPKPTGADWNQYVATTRQEFVGSHLVCLLYLNDRCIGAAHAVTDNARDAAIFGLVVHPDYRCKGFGTLIVRELLKDLQNVSVILHASEFSERIFQKLGFRPLKRAMGLRYSESDYAS